MLCPAAGHRPKAALAPGPDGWDRFAIEHWTVVRKDHRFAALYAGEADSDRHWRIGYAESDDGIAWTRAGQPVLEPGPSGSWDSYFVIPAAVLEAGDQYLMYYWGGSDPFVPIAV